MTDTGPTVPQPWDNPSIARAIFAENGRQVAAAYAAFADALMDVLPCFDSGKETNRFLRDEAEKAREWAQRWSGYVEDMEQSPPVLIEGEELPGEPTAEPG